MATTNRAWARLPSEDAARVSHECAKALETSLGAEIRERCDLLSTLYYGTAIPDAPLVRDLRGIGGDSFLTDNVVASCSDTLIAATIANRIRPMFVTDGGSYSEQRRAQAMQRAVEGLWHELDVWYSRAEDTATDGFVRGMGATYVWPDVGSMRVRHERLHPWEVLYHPMDARRGDPRTLYIVQDVPRDVLRASLAGDAQGIEAVDMADTARGDVGGYNTQEAVDEVTDRVRLVRAFHLPSCAVDRDKNASWGYGDDDKPIPQSEWGHDGRLVVSVDGRLVSDEPWPYDYFPVAMFRPKRHDGGLRGRGVPEQIAGIQLEIVRVLQQIAAIMRLMASPFIGYDSARVNPLKLATNEHGRLIATRGPPSQALQMFSWSAVPGELWQMWRELIGRAHALSGVSELTASAKHPARVDSAPALQYLADVESLRHMPSYRAWEGYHVQLAQLDTDAFRVLAKAAEMRGEGEKVRIMWHDDRELVEIDWAESDLGELKYRLATWPANLLPKTPSGQIALMFDLVERGFMPPDVAMNLVRFPDLDSAQREQRAPVEAVQAKIDAAITGDMRRATPSTYSNLELLLRHALARYQELDGKGASAAELSRLRWLIEQTQMQIEQAQAAAVPQLGAPGMPQSTPIVPGAPAEPMAPQPGAPLA